MGIDRLKIMMDIYNTLLAAHGHRGWWPVTRRGKLIPEYIVRTDADRITEQQRFETAIGAILTQNTSWSNAKLAIININRKNIMAVGALSKSPAAKIRAAIRPSGYFNQKTLKLKHFLKFLNVTAKGKLSVLSRYDTGVIRKMLLGVYGIGPETADSILLYACAKPVFVVDAYTRRIFSRHGWIGGTEPYDVVREWFESSLPESTELFQDYHAQIVETAKLYCHSRNPDCGKCPLYTPKTFRNSKVYREWKRKYRNPRLTQ